MRVLKKRKPRETSVKVKTVEAVEESPVKKARTKRTTRTKRTKAPKEETKRIISVEEALDKIQQLGTLKEQIKLLETRANELKADLKEFTVAKGVEDNKGSFNCKLGDYVLTNTKRVGAKLNNAKAVEELTALGLLEKYSKIEHKVVPELIEKGLDAEELPEDILDTIMDTTTSFAFTFKECVKEDENKA